MAPKFSKPKMSWAEKEMLPTYKLSDKDLLAAQHVFIIQSQILEEGSTTDLPVDIRTGNTRILIGVHVSRVYMFDADLGGHELDVHALLVHC